MNKIQHILFPVDFTDHCIQSAPYVHALASRSGARISMLHVVQPAYWLSGGELTNDGSNVDLTMMKERRREQIEQFLKDDFADLQVTRTLAQGDPSEVISNFAAREMADLIMMPTRGQGTFRRFLLGSVAAKVLHDAPCPVWTNVHRNEAAPPGHVAYETILCAVDLSAKSVPLLRSSIEFASAQEAALRVLHVEPAVEEESQNRGSIQVRKYLYAQARERWKAIQQEVPIQTDLQLAGGPVAAAIRKAALACKADLVLIGRGHLQEPLGGIRTEAYGIIRESPCPVLSV